MSDPSSPADAPAAGQSHMHDLLPASPGVPEEVKESGGAEHAMALAPADPTSFVEQKLLEGKVIEALRTVFDPEIPVNIYELGLIYEIKVEPQNRVFVKMTLTAPACPVAGTLPGDVENKINAIPEVSEAKVELVWDPPWSRERMSEAAQLQLGFL
jgi:FeS assembly SUF system protein